MKKREKILIVIFLVIIWILLFFFHRKRKQCRDYKATFLSDEDGTPTIVKPIILPVADFSAAPEDGNAPLVVTFTDLSTGNPIEWAWDFGDGNTSTEQNPTHTYDNPGIYSVTLTVTNDCGQDSIYRFEAIAVEMPPPIAEFTADTFSGEPDLLVNFTDQSTGFIDTWFWDFGDGNTSTLQNPGHTYTTPGTYNVTLTVTNTGGSDSITKSAYIDVQYVVNLNRISGPIGTLITITSLAVPATNTFYIGGIEGIIVSKTGNTLVGMVNKNTVSGAIELVTNSYSAFSTTLWTTSSCGLTPATLQAGSFIPASSAIGAGAAISADGDTMAVAVAPTGDPDGKIAIYVRNAGVWTQQGGLLAVGGPPALSADGNTMVCGSQNITIAPGVTGGFYVFTRSGGVWTQQGGPYHGYTGPQVGSFQGGFVSISADGNVVTSRQVGGYANSGFYIFTRSAGIWTETTFIPGFGATAAIVASDGKRIAATDAFSNVSNTFIRVYHLVLGVWTLEQSLALSDPAVDVNFAITLCISANGDQIVAQASSLVAVDNTLQGFLVWDRVGTSWSPRGGVTWVSQDIGSLRGSGYTSLSMNASGCKFVFGAPYHGDMPGRIFVFSWNGSAWVITYQTTDPLISPPLKFGHSAPISSDSTTMAITHFGPFTGTYGNTYLGGSGGTYVYVN